MFWKPKIIIPKEIIIIPISSKLEILTYCNIYHFIKFGNKIFPFVIKSIKYINANIYIAIDK